MLYNKFKFILWYCIYFISYLILILLLSYFKVSLNIAFCCGGIHCLFMRVIFDKYVIYK